MGEQLPSAVQSSEAGPNSSEDFRASLSQQEESTMNTNSKGTNSKQAMAWTLVLIILGIAALYGGAKWLTLLVPAAALVWYGVGPILGCGRN